MPHQRKESHTHRMMLRDSTDHSTKTPMAWSSSNNLVPFVPRIFKLCTKLQIETKFICAITLLLAVSVETVNLTSIARDVHASTPSNVYSTSTANENSMLTQLTSKVAKEQTKSSSQTPYERFVQETRVEVATSATTIKQTCNSVPKLKLFLSQKNLTTSPLNNDVPANESKVLNENNFRPPTSRDAFISQSREQHQGSNSAKLDSNLEANALHMSKKVKCSSSVTFDDTQLKSSPGHLNSSRIPGSHNESSVIQVMVINSTVNKRLSSLETMNYTDDSVNSTSDIRVQFNMHPSNISDKRVDDSGMQRPLEPVINDESINNEQITPLVMSASLVLLQGTPVITNLTPIFSNSIDSMNKFATTGDNNDNNVTWFSKLSETIKQSTKHSSNNVTPMNSYTRQVKSDRKEKLITNKDDGEKDAKSNLYMEMYMHPANDEDEESDLTEILDEINGQKGIVTTAPPFIMSNESFGEVVDGMTLIESIGMIIPCVLIILATIIGNILVIVAIFTYRPLKQVQHMYLVSLAVADITVAVFVLPFNIIYTIRRRWDFGLFVCKFWLTCDICCCTASILNLCAIAIDRYQAIHDPINYAQKRTLKRVLIGIAFVWLLSTLISIPPLLGWNDWPDHFTPSTPCTLTSERGFVIYSSSGSFFIPLIIMSIVYYKIFSATRRRLRARAKSAETRMNNLRSVATTVTRAPSLNQSSDGKHKIAQGVTVLPATAIKSHDPLLSGTCEEEACIAPITAMHIPNDEITEEISPPDINESVANETVNQAYLDDRGPSNDRLNHEKTKEAAVAVRKRSRFTMYLLGDGEKAGLLRRSKKSDSVLAVSPAQDAMASDQVAIPDTGNCNLLQTNITMKQFASENETRVMQPVTSKYKMSFLFGEKRKNSIINKKARKDDLHKQERVMMHVIESSSSSCEKISPTHDTPQVPGKTSIVTTTSKCASVVKSNVLIERTSATSITGAQASPSIESSCASDQTTVKIKSDSIDGEMISKQADQSKFESNGFQINITSRCCEDEMTCDDKSNDTPCRLATGKRFPMKVHSAGPCKDSIHDSYPVHQEKHPLNTHSDSRDPHCKHHVELQSVKSVQSTEGKEDSSGSSTIDTQHSNLKIDSLERDNHTIDATCTMVSECGQVTLCQMDKQKSTSHVVEDNFIASYTQNTSHKNELTGGIDNYFCDNSVASSSRESVEILESEVRDVRESEQEEYQITVAREKRKNGNEEDVEDEESTVASLSSGDRSKFHRPSSTRGGGSSASSSASTADAASRTSNCQPPYTSRLDREKSSLRKKVRHELDQERSAGTSTTGTTEDAFPLVKVAGATCSSLRSSILTSSNTIHDETKVNSSRALSVPCVNFSASRSSSHITSSASSSAARKGLTSDNNDECKSNSNLLCVDSSRYASTTGSGVTSSCMRSKCITDAESSFGSSLPASTMGAPTTSSHPSVMTQVFEEKQKISLSRERKAARVLGIVMGVFVACWLPFFLMYVILAFVEQQIPRWLENGITWLGYVNSALNPIIYTVFNLDFRRAFMKILSCK